MSYEAALERFRDHAEWFINQATPDMREILRHGAWHANQLEAFDAYTAIMLHHGWLEGGAA